MWVVRWMMGDLPWFLPGLALSAIVGAVVAAPLARWLGTRWVVAFLLVLGFGAVLSATLTPTGSPPRQIGAVCDLSRFWLAPLGQYRHFTEISLNVLLFMPLGVAIGLLPWARRSALVLAIAVATPFAIEATQIMARTFGRGCQSGDVVDNLLGLALGLVGTRLALIVVERLRSGSATDGGR